MRIQIAVALIAFLLLRMAHGLQNSVPNLLGFTRLVANNLMHRRSIDRLLDLPPPILTDRRQLSLNLCQTWTGQPWIKSGNDEGGDCLASS